MDLSINYQHMATWSLYNITTISKATFIARVRLITNFSHRKNVVAFASYDSVWRVNNWPHFIFLIFFQFYGAKCKTHVSEHNYLWLANIERYTCMYIYSHISSSSSASHKMQINLIEIEATKRYVLVVIFIKQPAVVWLTLYSTLHGIFTFADGCGL